MGKSRGGARCSEPRCAFAKLQTFPGTPGHILVPEARQMETNFFFSQDPEAAFGTESATRV